MNERLHPLTPFVKGWIGLLGLGYFLVRNWLENGGRIDHDRWGWWGWIALAALALSVVVGVLAWRATTFRLDEDALRISRRLVWHSQTVVNYSKVQSIDVVTPFAARLVGVCGLRIDVGSGSPHALDYLSRRRAEEIRAELARRAALQRQEPAIAAPTPSDDVVAVALRPGRLVGAAVLSPEFLGALVLTVATLTPSLVTGTVALAGLLVPAVWGLIGVVGNRVVKEWNYRLHLTSSPSGPGMGSVLGMGPGLGMGRTTGGGDIVRVARGLTDTVTQTVPVSRVQGFELTQPLTWRPFGWWRVRFTVLGYHGDDADKGASTVLLPAGTRAEVSTALRTIWPELDLDTLAWNGVPRRARWLHPLDWSRRAWTMTDQVIAMRSGRLTRRVALVAHARAQSWQVSQGPLERRLGLGELSVHLSGSVVEATLSGVSADEARGWLDGYSERVRSAIARVDPRHVGSDPGELHRGTPL